MMQKSSIIINIISVCLFLLAGICGVYAIQEATVQLSGSISYQAINPVSLSTQVTGAKFNGSANTLYVQSDGDINTNNNTFTVGGNCSSLTVDYGNVEFVKNSTGFTNIVTTFSFTNKKSTAICAKLSTDDFNPHPDITCIATDYMLKLNQNDTQTIEVTMGVLGTHATAPSLSTGTLKFTFEEFNVPTWEGSGYSGDVDYENKTISITRVPSGTGELDIPGYFYDSTNDCLLKVTKLDGDDVGMRGLGGYSSVIVPNTVEWLKDQVFNTWGNIKQITLKKGLLTIDSHTFAYSGIENIVIPNSVTSLYGSTFACCDSLTSVTLLNHEANLAYTFNGCINLTSIIFPKGITSIGERTFVGCSSLKTLTIPSTVTSIGNYVFESCTSLTSITIPDSVTSIGSSAFYDCTGLTYLEFAGTKTWQYSSIANFGAIDGEVTFNANTDYREYFTATSGTYYNKYWRVKP